MDVCSTTLEIRMRVVSRRLLVIGLTGGVVAAATAQDAPPIARYVPSAPDVRHVFVLDSAHLLSPRVVAALQDSASALQTETAADVAWVTLPTLGGRPIEEAALYIGRTWRIGSAGQPGDPLRNRGVVILYVPDKTKTAGSNFRVEVGNGLEGTITDSRSRAISLAMRENLRAKHYDDAYMAGWGVAAALVRTDFASHGDAGRAAAQAALVSRAPRAHDPVTHQLERASPFLIVVPMMFMGLFIALFVLLISSRRRARGPMMFIPTSNPNDDDSIRRTSWLSTSGGSDSGGSDSGGSSGSDGGSFGDGGGFSGGGSSDSI
jgi:uncharacterized protein